MQSSISRQLFSAAVFAAASIMFLGTAADGFARTCSPFQSATKKKEMQDSAVDGDKASKELKTREPTAKDGELKWKFTKGQVTTAAMKQNVTMTMNVAGQNMETKTNSVNEMSLTVDSVDENGVASVSNVIKRMKVSSSSPMAGTFEYDSESDEEPEGQGAMIKEMLAPMIGQTITQKMAKTGKIYDVKIPAEVLEAIQANPMMGQMFNEKTFEDLASKSTIEFPEKEIVIGTTWEVDAEVKMGPIVLETKTSYEYRGVADVDGTPYHVIKGKVSMSFPEGAVQGAEIEVLSEDTNVVMLFDGNAGRMVKSTLDQNMEMEIVAGGQTIQQNVVQKMDITVTGE